MKMAYETPKMKAELFQTNAYCVVCDNTPVFAGWVKVSALFAGMTEAVELIFKSTDKVLSLNQYTREEQYYYHWENNRANDSWNKTGNDAWMNKDYYLEYSAPYSEEGNETFVLYQETANSGFYYDDRPGAYVEQNGVQIGNGSTSLQTNVGNPPNFEMDEEASNTYLSRGQGESFFDPYDGTEFLYNGERVHANYWRPDICIGRVEKVDGKYTPENS